MKKYSIVWVLRQEKDTGCESGWPAGKVGSSSGHLFYSFGFLHYSPIANLHNCTVIEKIQSKLVHVLMSRLNLHKSPLILKLG